MLRVGGKLFDPLAQHVLVYVQIARRLRCRHAAITYQLHRLELESPVKPLTGPIQKRAALAGLPRSP